MDRREVMNLVGAGAIGGIIGYYTGAKKLLGIQPAQSDSQSINSVTSTPIPTPTPTSTPNQQEITDGFESGAYDDGNPVTWQVASAGDHITVQSNVVKNGDYALEARSGQETHAILYHHAVNRKITDGDVFSVWMRAEARAWVELTMRSEGRASGPHSIRAQLFTDHNNFNIDTFDGDTDKINKRTIGSPKPNTWYLIELEIHPSQSELTGRLFDSSKALLGEKTLATSGATDLEYTRLHVPPLFDEKYSGWFDKVSIR